MGVWGFKLYSGDFAMDLRSTIAAVARLPFDHDQLVEILCDTEPEASRNRNNEDHTIFWLVVADQFAKRGMPCDRVRLRAIEIIDSDEDIAMLEKLGMTPNGLAKRRQVLRELRERVVATVSKPRTLLKKPEALLMETGDVIVYPTCDGKCINPYFPSKELNIHYSRTGPGRWIQNGWGAALIIDCGRAFGFLSWYRPLILATARTERPALASLRGDILWRIELTGTCSQTHFRKMELEKIGTLPVDPEKVRHVFPGLRPGISSAVSDISIANRLNTSQHAVSLKTHDPQQPAQGVPTAIMGIGQLLKFDH